MSLSVGIVGLPNVGKSTLFKALTRKQVDIANYPFCTIEPNIGIVKVPDERLDKLATFFQPKKVIPTIVEFVDIAGLVKGAHEGEGLGNQFLSHIRETQAICQVVRCFEDSEVVHVEESLDPVRDIETINTELLLKDLETVRKRREREKEKEKEEILQDLQNALNKGVLARDFLEQHLKAQDMVKELQLLTAKPVFYACNANNGKLPSALRSFFSEKRVSFVILNMKEEMEIADLSLESMQELGLQSHLADLVKKAYEALDLITFFTAGADEVRAWTVRRGAKAPQAGGVIHSDFEEKFIRAAVISWDKLLQAGGLSQALAKGWMRTEGKDYTMQDGDVIEIRHG